MECIKTKVNTNEQHRVEVRDFSHEGNAWTCALEVLNVNKRKLQGGHQLQEARGKMKGMCQFIVKGPGERSTNFLLRLAGTAFTIH